MLVFDLAFVLTAPAPWVRADRWWQDGITGLAIALSLDAGSIIC